jgi:hypothetical protein
MADRDGFIPVQRRSNSIKPPKIVPLLPPVPTTLITQTSPDPNRFIENVRAEIVTPSPNRSIPRAERTTFNIASALQDVCNILFIHTPNLAIKSSQIPLTNMTSVSDFPKDDTQVKEFFHIDSKPRPDGGHTFFVYFSIESAVTEGIDNITDTNPIAQFLKENMVYIQPHDFNTFSTIILGSLFKKSHYHADSGITQVNLTTALYNALSQQMGDMDDQENPTDPNAEEHDQLVPYFSIITRTIRHTTYTQPNDNRVLLDTKALMIRCSTKDAEELSQLILIADLKETEFGIFVPTKWANTMGVKYGEYIMAHNEYLDTITKITVTGLHRDLFDTRLQYPEGSSKWCTIYDILLFEHFQPFAQSVTAPTTKTNLISAIEETQYSDSDGTWYFITKKELRFETIEFLSMIFHERCASEPAFLRHKDDSDTFHQGIIINTPLTQHTNDPFLSYSTTINFPLARNPHSSANTSLIHNNSQRRNNFYQLNHNHPIPIPPLQLHHHITQYGEPTPSQDNNSQQSQIQHITPHSASIAHAAAWPAIKPAAKPASHAIIPRTLPRTPWSIQPSNDNTLSTITQPTSTSMTTLASTITSIASDQTALRQQMQEFMATSIRNQNITLQQQQTQATQNLLITSLLEKLTRDINPDPNSRKRSNEDSASATSPPGTDDMDELDSNNPRQHTGPSG